MPVMRLQWLALAVLSMAALPDATVGAGQSDALCREATPLVVRSAAFLAEAGAALGDVIAVEDYRQEVAGPAEPPRDAPPPINIMPGVQAQPAAPMSTRHASNQRLRSSFLFVRTAGDGWIGFRDVFEVNGRPVDGSRRSRVPLAVIGEAALAQWRRLSDESARYNVGGITRTLNVPTFALLVLHPRNHTRFGFSAAREPGASGTCLLTFQESASPTIVRSGIGDDIPSSGNFDIDGATGRILRSELIAGNSAAGVASKTTVRYEQDTRLKMWVPRQMQDEYVARSGERVRGVATYSNYQRVEVTATIRPGT